LIIIRRPFDSILGSIGSKVKVVKRSTSYFYHSAVNFYPIGMQLMPKCSQFNEQSCDMRRYALYRVPVLVTHLNSEQTGDTQNSGEDKSRPREAGGRGWEEGCPDRFPATTVTWRGDGWTRGIIQACGLFYCPVPPTTDTSGVCQSVGNFHLQGKDVA